MNVDLIIDQNIISELKVTVGDDFLVELIDTYLEETPRLLSELEQFLLKQDAAAFGRTAHSIKSSSASLGALSFSAQAKELEMMGKSGELAGADVKVKALGVDYKRVQIALKELKDGS